MKLLPVRLALSLFILALAPAAALHAQLPKIFVASFGNDANDGTRNAPKRNFQAAHTAVQDGGQIVVLDTAGYGALSITKNLSITVPPGVNGFVTINGGTGVNINVGASGKVALRGLIVEGPGTSAGYGIYVASAGAVVLEDCTVRNLSEGIFAFTTTALKLNLANCVARDCAYGLDVENNATVGVVAVATGCRLEDCSSDNFLAAGGSGSVDVTLADCTVTGAGIYGVSASGSVVVVRVESSRVVGNSTGISVNSSAQVLSRGNNTVEKNVSGNVFLAGSTYNAK